MHTHEKRISLLKALRAVNEHCYGIPKGDNYLIIIQSYRDMHPTSLLLDKNDTVVQTGDVYCEVDRAPL